jgi:hypothetical protein
MAKTRVLYRNLAWDPTVTVASTGDASGYPATNALSQKRSLPWRSTTTTGNQSITFTFSGSKTVLAIVAGNYKIHTGGTLTAQWANGGAFTSLGTFTIPSSNRTKLVALFVSQACTQIRFLFTNTGSVNEFVELGLPVIVDATGYFQATVNYADGLNLVPTDPSPATTSVGGQEQSRTLPSYLQFTAQFIDVPEATDFTSWLAIRDYVGCRLPFVLALDPDNPDKIVFGKMPTQLQTTQRPRTYWNVSLPFREMV